MSHAVRPAAVAGLFYPASRSELTIVVDSLLASARTEPQADRHPRALIVPHAGYVYSGAIAASAYSTLLGWKDGISRIVLIGPAHRLAFRGLAAPGADFLASPFGEMPVDRDAIETLNRFPFVIRSDEAHANEHCLEVQLPFLQKIFGPVPVVPLLAGTCSSDEILAVLEALADRKTLTIISSDLSHYYDYETARKFDEKTCRAIETLTPEEIGSEQACGRLPVQAMLMLAEKQKLKVRTLDLRNSGDTAGSSHEVVGYGAWLFTEPDAH